MCEECREKNNKGIVGGILAAGALAAGIFYLFGTDSGRKMQKKIKKKGEEAIETLGDMLEDLEEKGREYKEKAEEIAAAVKGEAEKKWEKGSEIAKQQVGEKLDRVLTKSEDLLEKGREATESLHKDLKSKFSKD